MKFQRLFSILLTDCMEASLNVSVNSGDKIYVAVAHDYDGDTATGRVSVRHG